MKVYIAGPMSGIPGYNLQAFADAKLALDECGYDAVNPGHRGVIDGYSWSDYMRDALALLVTCDAVAYLPRSSNSRGARLELYVAQQLKLRVAPLTTYLEQGRSE